MQSLLFPDDLLRIIFATVSIHIPKTTFPVQESWEKSLEHLYSKYVQIKICGQVLYEEFPVIHEKGLNYFFTKHPQLLFLNYSYYLTLEEHHMCTHKI